MPAKASVDQAVVVIDSAPAESYKAAAFCGPGASRARGALSFARLSVRAIAPGGNS